ncbi:MAG: 4-alpha-glucanotransferase [Clostridia bacterium]|nr:4-alpha-glucanotransferase [Clostridia bacterium]
MHIASLPNPGGIGTLGKAAYEFVDFVRDSGMNIWQVLPVGPTDFGDSPYQSTSTFAGNPLLIDPDKLISEGFLPIDSYEPLPIAKTIDYEAVKAQRKDLLHRAFDYSAFLFRDEIREFSESHPRIRPYALFRALKDHFGGVSWMAWPDQAIRRREPEALKKYSELLKKETDYYCFEQFLFFRQWQQLHDYAKGNNVQIMGDMPIYVSEDSSDVWLNPELFELDDDLKPIRIAGVPPDYFQIKGQRWGNPLYRWDVHEETGFAWWIDRLGTAGSLYDILRIDHFIGFANYYAIPAEYEDAIIGVYEPGPGMKLFDAIKEALPNLEIVAEDLGTVTPPVKKLLDDCGFPGMKVMQFAYDSDETNVHHPENTAENSFYYTGTHDNNTAIGWWADASEDTKAYARLCLELPEDSDNILPAMTKQLFESDAKTVIVPMQDWLELGGEARMNFPGTLGNNWGWRMQPTPLNDIRARIRTLNRLYGRGNVAPVNRDEMPPRRTKPPVNPKKVAEEPEIDETDETVTTPSKEEEEA